MITVELILGQFMTTFIEEDNQDMQIQDWLDREWMNQWMNNMIQLMFSFKTN